jgi:carbonic anhydrase/acetyltransferase-like protein (isoleucine patch superfamily)
VRVGAGSSIWFGAVIRGDVADIDIGQCTNIQDGAIVHADTAFPTEIGDYVTVGHRAVLHGCRIGSRVLVGMGAIVMDGAVVGEGALIGAGAVVTPGTQVPPGVLVLGTPGRPVRELGPENAAHQQAWAERYRSLWETNYR